MTKTTPYKNALVGLLSLASVLPDGTTASVLPRTQECQRQQYPGPKNPSFETGDLSGWTVVNGTAFGKSSVTTAASSQLGSGPFNQVGKQFLSTNLQDGEAATGTLRSSTFKASSVMSFLIGGNYDPANLYVGLVLEKDGSLLFSQTATNDEALIRIVWDTSAYAGQNVYLVVVDTSTTGHISLDDVRTGCDALKDGPHTFNILGQSNQPTSKNLTALSAASRYAVDPTRPQYHYTPYQGWINDPAGLIQWGGKYHLFNQYNPVAPLWGPMYWSHAESTDAVHWRDLPVALTPPYVNNTQDTSGRYTGSAVKNQDTGALQLIYTDATNVTYHPHAVPEVVSSAVSSDGIHFDLYSGNPIVAEAPPTSSAGFRDPKVFWDPTANNWKMVVGSGDGHTGNVQLYKSTGPSSSELLSWEYVGVLHQGDGSRGIMWECPNFFPIDDKWVLFYGQDKGFKGWYEVGSFNGTTFVSEKLGLFDSGPDSYATQWFVDDAGRNLAVTWINNWNTTKWPSRVNGWAGTQSIMRELFIREDGGLGQKPVEEVSLLASGPAKSLGQTDVFGTYEVGFTDTARLQATVDLAASDAPAFTIELFASGAESTSLVYNFANRSLTIDTMNAGYGQAGTWEATIAKPADNRLSLDILIDRSSIEVFVGDGTAMTVRVFPRYQESKNIRITSDGGKKTVFDDIVLTPMGSAWE
ncbi:glycoside hydrolase family 32 protein [Neurospora crassa]|uniref:beta-fructofuranosidase n=2 Tax=Neurospora crassa TaxID=5141 RepID=Q1K7I2_NEUCR|nr:invertase [Neurospora crassa OR74A]EAA32020.1 invertase [Neurospora crassa OR74A]KHE86113.1 glycoside hydrolase family 32 protein [Neurospora crassa]CAC28747.2 related to beta-fructofuranosidase [Neurospora crassa]|eukprot:XP_961256.1 invertase [Neurospora crassa OR74A]